MIGIPEKQLNLDKKKHYSFVYSIKYAFKRIKEELDDHLHGINANTSEIQSNYEYISELNHKIEKLSSRIDEMQLFFNNLNQIDFLSKDKTDMFDVKPLTVNEKRIFIVLYTAKEHLTYEDIANALNLSDSLVKSYITNLIKKGIPLIKRFVKGNALISLDKQFKELQARKNIIKISQKQLGNF